MVAYRKLVTPDESSELRGFLFSREKKKNSSSKTFDRKQRDTCFRRRRVKKKEKKTRKENRNIGKKAFPHFHRTDPAIHR